MSDNASPEPLSSGTTAVSGSDSSSNAESTKPSDPARAATARFDDRPSVTQSTPPAPTQTDDDPRIGTIVADRYKLLRLLGMGGMGAVYLGEHTTLRKRVAVKFLRAELTQTAEIVARFEREAVAAATIDHPNVVAAHDFGKDGKEPNACFFLVMDYVDGTTLGALLESNTTLPPERVLGIAKDVGAALAAAHHKAIVHRDLKPDNIVLVQRDGAREVAKVIDFGIAKVSTISGSKENGAPLTQAGMVFGTPEYMAPEQALGVDVDHRADLYAFAVLLFEALAGRRPYVSDDVVSLLGMQLSAEIPMLSEVANNSTYAPALDSFFTKALAKKRDQRFASAQEMIEAFELACSAHLSPSANHSGRTSALSSADVSQSATLGPIASQAGVGPQPSLPSPASTTGPTTTAAASTPTGRSSIIAHGETLLEMSRETAVTLAAATEQAWKSTANEPKQRQKVIGVGVAMLLGAIVLGPVRHSMSERSRHTEHTEHTSTQHTTHTQTPALHNNHTVNSLLNSMLPSNNTALQVPTPSVGGPAPIPVVTANPATGNLAADLAAFRADPRIHVLLDRRSMQSLRSKIEALELYRQTDSNPLLTYTVGTLYAQQGPRAEALMIERFEQALTQRPDLATDETLLDAVLAARIRARGATVQRINALLHGPLERYAPARVFARLAQEPTRRGREQHIALLTREFPTAIDTAAIPLIDLYRSRNCTQLKASVEALATSGDGRAVLALQSLPRPPQRCGWSVCNPCLGDSVDRALTAIQVRQNL